MKVNRFNILASIILTATVIVCTPLSAQLVPGFRYEYDGANAPVGGKWVQTVASSDTSGAFNWTLGANVVQTTSPTGAPVGITGAYVFPGTSTTNDSLERATTATYNGFSTADSTWEFWFKLNDVGTNQVIWESGGSVDGSSLVVRNDGNLQFTIKDGGASASAVAAFPSDLGSFHQVAAVYDNAGTDTVRLYIDGVAQGTVGSVSGLNDFAGGDNSGLGGYNGSLGGDTSQGLVVASYNNTLDAEIGLYRFYNGGSGALDAEQVWSNYVAETGKYWRGGQSGGTIGWQNNNNWYADEAGTTSATRAGADEVVILRTTNASGTADVLQINFNGTSHILTETGSFYVLPDANFAGNLFEVREGGSSPTNGTLTLTHQRAIDFRTDNAGPARILDFNADGSDGNHEAYSLAFGNGAAGSIINVEGANDRVKVSFDIVDAGSNNSTSITKTGAGTLELSGNNATYTGTMTVSGGTLELVDGAIASGRDYGPIATGATLEFNRTSGSVNVGVIDLSGGGTFKKSGNGTLTNVSAGSTVALGGTGLFHVADGTYIFGGAGLGNWTNNLADLQVEAGASFRGEATAIYVDALTGGGSVRIGGVAGGGALNGDGLTVGVNNGSGTFSGTISDATNGNQHSLTKVGTGTQTLSGALSYTGTTTVNGGTLELVNAAITSGRDYGPIATGATLEFNRTSGSVNVGVIDLSGGGTFKKSGNGTITHVSAGSTVALGGTGLFHVADGTYIFGATGLGNWTNNLADLQVDTGATFRGEATAIYVDALTGGGSVQIGGVAGGGALNGDGLTVGVNNGSGTFSGTISDATNGNQHSLTKVGTGTQTLSGNNTYTGNTTIVAGTLQLGASGVIPDVSPVVQSGGTFNLNNFNETIHSYQATGGTLNFGGNSELTVLNDSNVNNITVGTTGILHVADGVTVTQSGTTSLLGPNESLTFDVGVGALANMSGDINTGKGDGQINKTGPGTLRLTSNASQYGGGNRIENGVLEFTSIVNAGTDETSSLGDADFQDVLQIGSNANAATLRMLGANAKNSSDRAVQLGNGGATIDIDDAGQKLTLSGVVSNHNSSGSLTKEGEGTLVLSGQNTYSGTTSVNAGELIINGNTSGQGDFTVASGARLGGDGTIGANVIIASSHGDISPGDKGSLPSGPFPAGSSAASFSYSAGTDFETVGSMGVSGDVDLGGYLLIDLMSQGTDMLNVGGEFTINTNQNAQLEINGTTDLSEIDFWSILDWTAPGPSIDLVTFSNFGGGQFANVGFNQEFSDAGGHSVVLGFDADSIFLVATPEPESIAIWSLLGLALAGFGYYRTRCK